MIFITYSTLDYLRNNMEETMNIKYVLGVLVVILLLGNIFFIYEMQNSNQSMNNDNNWTVINNKLIKLPENYSLENMSNQVNISNGSDVINIFKITGSDMDSAIDKYVNTFNENYTIKTEDFDTSVPCKKTNAINNNSAVTKYWFKIDNDVYQIQTSKNDANVDNIVREMINSMA